jgi:hypothetical protein
LRRAEGANYWMAGSDRSEVRFDCGRIQGSFQ